MKLFSELTTIDNDLKKSLSWMKSIILRKDDVMTKNQLKIEIAKSLEEMPEQVLENVLSYLEKLKAEQDSSEALNQLLSTILEEDKNLLNRIAK